MAEEDLNKRVDSAVTSVAIAEGVVQKGGVNRTARGVHILVAGQLNFIDAEGTTVNMTAGFFAAGGQYFYQIKEILSGTTATGRLML